MTAIPEYGNRPSDTTLVRSLPSAHDNQTKLMRSLQVQPRGKYAALPSSLSGAYPHVARVL